VEADTARLLQLRASHLPLTLPTALPYHRHSCTLPRRLHLTAGCSQPPPRFAAPLHARHLTPYACASGSGCRTPVIAAARALRACARAAADAAPSRPGRLALCAVSLHVSAHACAALAMGLTTRPHAAGRRVCAGRHTHASSITSGLTLPERAADAPAIARRKRSALAHSAPSYAVAACSRQQHR